MGERRHIFHPLWFESFSVLSVSSAVEYYIVCITQYIWWVLLCVTQYIRWVLLCITQYIWWVLLCITQYIWWVLLCVHVQVVEACEVMILAILSSAVKCEWDLEDFEEAMITMVTVQCICSPFILQCCIYVYCVHTNFTAVNLNICFS